MPPVSLPLRASRTHPALTAVAVLLAAAFLIRAPLFGNPLIHIDEQFYLLVGDRMLGGLLPYVDIWDRKPIGLFLIYAAIRRLGGDGVVQYQILASLCAAGTALLIWEMSRAISSIRSAYFAAILYLVYLLPFNGAGGQSPVFYNLLVATAAWIVLGQGRKGRSVDASGLLFKGVVATTLLGLAIQVKYTVLFEGCYFGLLLVWQGSRRFHSALALAGAAALWALCGLAPTLAALLYYYHLGHAAEFIQANFLSIFGRHQMQLPALGRLILTALMLSPLLHCAFRAVQSARVTSAEDSIFWMLLGWMLTAIGGYLAFGSYYDHYALPLLVPICIVASRAFADPKTRRAQRVALVAGIVVGVLLVGVRLYSNGDERQLADLTSLIRSNLNGCLFVYEGDPALYETTHACFVTRFVFPSHLDNSKEADALGTSAVAEMQRALARSPSVIVMAERPRPYLANLTDRRLVEEAVRRRYRLAGTKFVGANKWLVFSRRPSA